MAEARVDSIEAIQAFKRALWRFAEIANAALTDAEAEALGTLRWLETEQRTYWQMNVRKSQELVARCEEAFRHKRIFKDASGRTPSAVDEEKALAKAKRQLEYANQRLENVRKYTPRLQREIMLYKGQMQRLSTFVAADIPVAAAKLDKIVATLSAYVNLSAQPASGGMMNLPAEVKEEPEGPAPSTQPADPSAKPSEPT